MCDEQREKLKGNVLSWLFDIGYLVGLYNIRVKDEKSLANKYCDGISLVRESTSAKEDKAGWDIILECFMESLNITSDIKLKPNYTPIDFKDNMDTIFESIGLPNGITNALEANSGRNPEAKRRIREVMAQADSIRGSKKWRTESLGQVTHAKTRIDHGTPSSTTANTEENILTLQISQLPESFCSEELKSMLSRRFSFVYELLSVDFSELKRTLGDNDNVPTKFLVELELFFRNHNIDFLSHLPASTKYEDEIARTVIRDSVTVFVTQFGKANKTDNKI